ncbi:glycoprotein-N-acetylgalactosamine 3-beta-galactosyltransferase 1-like isoform X3 [Pomacea canaliculata]|uniref:glycoprotein-N-acetylgalactosamine 3-beta-galactosyltransferase 1-like isoform X3 n=1 Tax=Pomacea canaliculata TaxID=400727 RepID=UPI000D73A5A6|nr:glycoprotein-N-acetylgalactosamine 3-beta-galactosyltransferase 1-like isoform X3 [Pomacea canaliculata]
MMLRKVLRPDCVGWAFSAIIICALMWTLYNLRTLPDCWAKPRHLTVADVGGSSEDPTIMVDDQAARALHLRVRVLCWLPSTKARLEGALKAVNETWGRRCDGRVYFVNTGHTANDVVDVGGLDGYDYLSSKSAAALKYLYHHHLHHYDWFIKGEDDTYIIVENLKLLLSHYNASSPVHLGTGYFNDHLPGGASYVLSREALRRVNEEGYRKMPDRRWSRRQGSR